MEDKIVNATFEEDSCGTLKVFLNRYLKRKNLSSFLGGNHLKKNDIVKATNKDNSIYTGEHLCVNLYLNIGIIKNDFYKGRLDVFQIF